MLWTLAVLLAVGGAVVPISRAGAEVDDATVVMADVIDALDV